jgi:hypothetical protein
MQKKLKVTLPEGWVDETESLGNGVLTYIRELSETPGPLQMSLAGYRGGKEPRATEDDLVGMAIQSGNEQNYGRLDESSGGACSSGHFGSAVFWSQEAPRLQIWWISNGLDFITVTHICPDTPDPTEVLEADRIVRSIEIVEE